MADLGDNRFKCDGIAYRAGFIEVQSVHENHVNLETWGINPDAIGDGINWVTDVDDDRITGNVEIEMDLRQALLLAESLQRLVRANPAIDTFETVCDECGSMFAASVATMSGLCPECSHYLYGKPNCAHSFRDGRCQLCRWDGAVSDYVATIKGTKNG